MKTLLLLGTACIAATSALAQTWVQHENKNGFRLSHPPGWVVETPDDRTIIARSADGSSLVLIHAFFEKQSVAAQNWVQQVPQKFATVFPKARIGQLRQRRSQSDDVLAQVEYTGRWGDCKASLLASVYQGSGMLYAIGAPMFQYDRRKDELLRVVQSFVVTGGPGAGQPNGAPGPAGPSGAAANLQYRRWSDPQEGAFTVEIPVGWNVQGGTFRRTAVDVKQWAKLSSPDGRITIFSHEPRLPGIYMMPIQGMPGYSNPAAPTMNYLNGLQFAEMLIRQYWLPGVPVRIVDRKNRVDLQQQYMAILNRYSVAGVQQGATFGEISFEFERGGQKFAGSVLAGTQGVVISGMGSWFALPPSGWVAPVPEVPTCLAVIEHGTQTFQMNAQWVQTQQGTTAKVSQINTETNRYISKTISDSYWSRQASNDRMSERRADVNRGRVRLQDPYTGEHYEAVSGKNYYYRHAPSGRIAGTNDTDRPNIDVTELRQVW